MIRRSLRKLCRDPLGFARQAVSKLLIDRIKYGRGGDYDAARYWRDRLSNRRNLRAVGDEGLSEADNRREYEAASVVFDRVCQALGRPVADCRVLEIGPGTGFYTKLLHDRGVTRYVGVDITDVRFPELEEQFPTAEFRRADIGRDAVEGEFDLVVMIDVIEHIVSEDQFAACLRAIDGALVSGGSFVVAPLTKRSRRHLFYVRYWSLSDVTDQLERYSVSHAEDFRDGQVVLLSKPRS